MDLAAGTTQFTILAFAGLLIAAAASDWRNLTVPNSYSLALAGLFPSYVLASGGGVEGFSCAFAVGRGARRTVAAARRAADCESAVNSA